MSNKYYLVWHGDKPISLVRIAGVCVKLIAGLDTGLLYFRRGEPYLSAVELPICVQIIASESWHPDVGAWVERCSRSMARKKVRHLCEAEKLTIVKLRRKGFRVETLAIRFDVSTSTVKRCVAP